MYRRLLCSCGVGHFTVKGPTNLRLGTTSSSGEVPWKTLEIIQTWSSTVNPLELHVVKVFGRNRKLSAYDGVLWRMRVPTAPRRNGTFTLCRLYFDGVGQIYRQLVTALGIPLTEPCLSNIMVP